MNQEKNVTDKRTSLTHTISLTHAHKHSNDHNRVKKILESCGRRPFCATRKALGNPWFNSGSLVLILECSEPIKVYQDNASIPVADVVVEVVYTLSDLRRHTVCHPVRTHQSVPVQSVQ